MTRIVLTSFGSFDQRSVDLILSVMRECYERLEPHETEIVDLYVFHKASTMDLVIAEEKEKLGVETSSLETSFFATHDAWQGTPRIMVCLEKMSGQPDLVNIGGLRHEVGHSVLHGSIEYYVIPTPQVLRRIEAEFELSRDLVNALLYLISIAVKDFEVTRILCEKGYIRDQVSYSKYFLQPSTEETLSWQLARANPIATFLCLASLMKDLGCSIPLFSDRRHGNEMRRAMEERIRGLPFEIRRKIRSLAFILPSKLDSDTIGNIIYVSQLFVEEFMIPKLKKRRQNPA